MTGPNPLYARPASTVHQRELFSVKVDHELPCAFCRGIPYPSDSMIVTFTEENPHEDPLYPGRSAARAAAHGEQPVPEPQRQLRGPQPLTDILVAYPERHRYIARALGHTQRFPERVRPVPDDLEPELDPERVTHSIDEPYAVVHAYDDAILFAQQLALFYGSVYVLAADPHPVDPAEDGQ